MMSSMSFHLRFALAALLASAAPLGALAQQTPITGQMGTPASPRADAPVTPAAPMPAPPYAADSAPASTGVGDTTRTLLSMQRQGTNAGKALPIPGQEASASYQRYLKSFEHPIPEFYDTTMSKSGNGGMGSSNTP